MDDLPWIYGAALAAAASETTAARVTEQVVRRAAPDAPRSRLVAEAVRQAVEGDPAAPFDRLPPGDRAALALVRLAGLRVDEVCDVLGEDAGTVKRRLTAGLRSLAGLPLLFKETPEKVPRPG